MTLEAIVDAIESKRLSLAYSEWTIGVSDDANRRRSEHEEERLVRRWAEWKTDSEVEGRAIKQYFVDLGMRGDEDGGDRAQYVYVF